MIGYYWLSSIIMLIFLLIGIEVYLDVHQNDPHLDIVSPDNVHHMARNLADKKVDVCEYRKSAVVFLLDVLYTWTSLTYMGYHQYINISR